MANKAAEKLLIEAALAWWQGKCPVAFTLDEHLKNPAINTETTYEYDLALAVAATIRFGSNATLEIVTRLLTQKQQK
jgi:hypothetical protein